MLLLALALLALLAACAAPPANPASPSLEDAAAVEATLIVQRARATAMILQAQQEADALLEPAQLATRTPAEEISLPTPEVSEPKSTDQEGTEAAPAPQTTPNEQLIVSSGESFVEIVEIAIAAEGHYVCVRFRATPSVAKLWNPGMLYLVDEKTGNTFSEIPRVPTMGVLIGKPVRDDQLGYVMFVNSSDPPLQSGDVVTVVLDEYKLEHIQIQ